MNSNNVLIALDDFTLHSCGSTDSSSRGSSDHSESLLALDPAAFYPLDVNSDVQLEVSGSSFVLNTCDFQKLAGLPWKRIHGQAFRLEGTSPDVFQMCMDFIVFESLPKKKKMSASDRQELASIAATLKLTALKDHLAGRKIHKKSKTSAKTTAPKKKHPKRNMSTWKLPFPLVEFLLRNQVLVMLQHLLRLVE